MTRTLFLAVWAAFLPTLAGAADPAAALAPSIERLDDGDVVDRASPMGRQATTFRATVASARTVRFENPAHDFPRWIEYRLRSDGRLCARIGGEGDEEDRVEE